MLAYKDLENSQCYLERMKDNERGRRIMLKRMQTLSRSAKLPHEPRTMYVSGNILSKYEVRVRVVHFQWRGNLVAHVKGVLLQKLIVTDGPGNYLLVMDCADPVQYSHEPAVSRISNTFSHFLMPFWGALTT
jgi:hypothetical protein